MRLIFLIISSIIAFAIVDASFVNPYPRFTAFRDGGDPGEALYLTKYIESGDLELVRNLIFFFFCSLLLFILACVCAIAD